MTALPVPYTVLFIVVSPDMISLAATIAAPAGDVGRPPAMRPTVKTISSVPRPDLHDQRACAADCARQVHRAVGQARQRTAQPREREVAGQRGRAAYRLAPTMANPPMRLAEPSVIVLDTSPSEPLTLVVLLLRASVPPLTVIVPANVLVMSLRTNLPMLIVGATPARISLKKMRSEFISP